MWQHTFLPLWYVEGLQVEVNIDGLLDAQQSPILILLYHLYIILVYHMVWDGRMFSERRLVVSVCGFLPLIPCVDLFLSDVSCFNSVIFESDIQRSSSTLSYVEWELVGH